MSIRAKELGEGDRLEHGVSLGVEARQWAARAGRLPLMREERLLDLSWEWSFYRRESIHPPTERSLLLSAEIGRLSAAIFEERLAPEEMEALHNEAWLRQVGFPDRGGSVGGRAQRWQQTEREHLLCRGFLYGDRLQW